MLPSHTVENYLKAIFLAQVALLPSEPLVPMGQLASALGVVPGTATTMVKALSESGLVRYEPYAGVRLTPAGEKLAARVLRRHRLIELFLVQVMGMSWTEVHDEAEHLEHAVSDRLIERIDEMLGRPSADPHGDPIPGPEGTLAKPEYDTLLTCPLGETVIVRRVSDQDSEFLRFVERHELKPGQVVRVEARDAAADSVRLRGAEREFTIGARAASKVLVQVAQVVAAFIVAILCSASASAQTAAPAKADGRAVRDHRQLLPRRGSVQSGAGHLSEHRRRALRRTGTGGSTSRRNGRSSRRSISCRTRCRRSTTAIGSGLGDTLTQLSVSGSGWRDLDGRHSRRAPAWSLPTGDVPRLRGSGSPGLQVNLPFSKQTGDWYWHWNARLHVAAARRVARPGAERRHAASI